jgi:hypothetical protein
MAAQQSKNDIGWETLFDRHGIVDKVDAHGLFKISATEINTVREARLMTKIDHIINLPSIFEKNSLSILPDSRGTYVIGRFDCYQKLPKFEPQDIEEASLPQGLESLSAEDIYSEPVALLCAHHAQLINSTLEQPLDLTVFGRMTTGKFDFSILDIGTGSHRAISVNNSQCEIDGGYEGNSVFALIEAKNQAVGDFNVRQLYYPYRLWSRKITKPVVPVFFTYSNEVFSFYVYRFNDLRDYNSLELERAKHFRIVPTEIEVEDVRRILAKTKVVPEPDVPFPQADTFERVIDLLTTLEGAKGALTQDEITTNYAFDVRQTQYYASATQYLGLTDKPQSSDLGMVYSLTTLGSNLTKKAAKARNLALVELILSRQVFRDAMEAYLKNGEIPPAAFIVNSMENSKIGINATTARRRAQTVIGWVRWIARLTVGD